jgi:hypothetical protein
MSRRLLLIALACATLGLGACGNKQETVTHGESEAFYVTLGSMQYQVQLSRQLNQYLPGDRDLLVGLSPADRALGPDEIWFGVWVQVVNGSSSPQTTANSFTIRDTKGGEYKPVPLAAANVFAYRPAEVESNGLYPRSGSAAANSPTTGAFLLFKMPKNTLDFRPLELEFGSTTLPGKVSSVRLDV